MKQMVSTVLPGLVAFYMSSREEELRACAQKPDGLYLSWTSPHRSQVILNSRFLRKRQVLSIISQHLCASFPFSNGGFQLWITVKHGVPSEGLVVIFEHHRWSSQLKSVDTYSEPLILPKSLKAGMRRYNRTFPALLWDYHHIIGRYSANPELVGKRKCGKNTRLSAVCVPWNELVLVLLALMTLRKKTYVFLTAANRYAAWNGFMMTMFIRFRAVSYLNSVNARFISRFLLENRHLDTALLQWIPSTTEQQHGKFTLDGRKHRYSAFTGFLRIHPNGADYIICQTAMQTCMKFWTVTSVFMVMSIKRMDWLPYLIYMVGGKPFLVW